MITAEERLLLRLVRMGLGNGGVCDLAERIEWNALLDLAVQQGVPAIVLDGVKDVLDLPQPLAPSTATNSPRFTLVDTPSSA